MKTPCCNYEAPEGLAYPVMWNPHNQVVQCHNCGEQYLPFSVAQNEFKRGCQTTMEWVSKICKDNTERLIVIGIPKEKT